MIEVHKSHAFSKPVLGQRTSPFLQEKLAVLGSEEVFGRVPERVALLLGITVSESQVYRTCQNLAEKLPEEVLSTPSPSLQAAEKEVGSVVYGMLDGSMLFTDEGWQETKVGRVFTAEPQGKDPFRWKMGPSQYVAKRGHYGAFTEQFERLLPPESLCKKVFVTDGAVWIGQWIREKYPEATHILDFFHVCEKLAEAVPQNPAWLSIQKTDLGEGKIDAVIERVKKQGLGEAAEKVSAYLENHRASMDYPHYRQQGWMIGSGPIESAHRTLLQVRMKRSGIRWADSGCDNMIKLRTALLNGQQHALNTLLRAAT